MSNKKFILVTGDVNGNSRQVKLSGIDLSRFLANPLMYYNHDTSKSPIGRWQNIKTETIRGVECLTAEAIFDTKDSLGKEIARKVQDGFIKSVSIGYIITEVNSTNNIDQVNKCQILEASIVDLPANQNAVKLDFIANSYHKDIFDSPTVSDAIPNFFSISDYLNYKPMKITKNLTDLLAFFNFSKVNTDDKDNLILSDSQVDDMNSKVADLHSKLSAAQDNLKAAQDDLKIANTENVVLKAAKDALQTQLDAANDKITLLSGGVKKDGADKQADIKDNKNVVDESHYSFNREADARNAKDTWGTL